MPRLISLTQGKSCIVDDEDYAWLSQWKWCYNSGYAKRGMRRDGKQIHFKMHRLIANTPKGLDTDHINRDKLDNRRCNLRVCGRPLNIMNRPKRRDNTSGFKGVTFHKDKNKFAAQIGINGRTKHLGFFYTPEEAYMEYRKAEIAVIEALCSL